MSKKRIQEFSLNIIEWGSVVFVMESTAQRYFHEPASQPSLQEGIRLAAVIPSPLRHRPTDDNDYVINKAQLILKRMSSRH